VLVALTQAGHALVDRVVDEVLGREAQLVRGLLPAERAELAALLDRLLQDVVGQTAGEVR
jgi:DNA-binding MarR family transcriptional regulator